MKGSWVGLLRMSIGGLSMGDRKNWRNVLRDSHPIFGKIVGNVVGSAVVLTSFIPAAMIAYFCGVTAGEYDSLRDREALQDFFDSFFPTGCYSEFKDVESSLSKIASFSYRSNRGKRCEDSIFCSSQASDGTYRSCYEAHFIEGKLRNVKRYDTLVSDGAGVFYGGLRNE